MFFKTVILSTICHPNKRKKKTLNESYIDEQTAFQRVAACYLINDLPTARSYWDWHCRHYGDIDWVQRANEQRGIESFIGVP